MASLSDAEIVEWRRTLAADESTQAAMPAQRPLSDAYKAGGLHKRHMTPETGVGEATKRRKLDESDEKQVKYYDWMCSAKCFLILFKGF